MKPKIAVIYGGYSSESEISKKSAITIFNNIDNERFAPYLVDVNKESWTVSCNDEKRVLDKNKFTFFEKEKEVGFDLAFITIHGTPAEDGKLPAYFDLIGLPYVNSNPFAASLSFNKWACNIFLRSFGIATAKSILLRRGEEVDASIIANELGFPCFVKPNDGGSSFGISKVAAIEEIETSIEKAFAEGDEVIIESFIEGREFTCGIYKIGTEITTLPPTEIISENDFFDYEAKYQGKSKEVTPADISSEKTEEMQAIAKKAFLKLGLSGIARIDFMLHPDGTFHVIEANTNPGMTAESIIPQQIAADGKELKKVFSDLLEATLSSKR